jgi:hypothetical protein
MRIIKKAMLVVFVAVVEVVWEAPATVVMAVVRVAPATVVMAVVRVAPAIVVVAVALAVSAIVVMAVALAAPAIVAAVNHKMEGTAASLESVWLLVATLVVRGLS